MSEKWLNSRNDATDAAYKYLHMNTQLNNILGNYCQLQVFNYAT